VELTVDAARADSGPNTLVLTVSHTVVVGDDPRRLGLAVESITWAPIP
jgi:hypothetical protein